MSHLTGNLLAIKVNDNLLFRFIMNIMRIMRMVTTSRTTMIMTIRKVLLLSGSPPGGTREEAEIKKL